MRTIQLKNLVLSAATSLLFASCGAQKPMVTDIQVKPYYQDSEVHVSLTSQLSLGNVSLPGVSLPVILPSNGMNIGHVQLQTLAGGKNLVTVDVNISQMAQVRATRAKLPNGNTLPIIGDNDVIVIPIQNKVNLYLTFNDSVAALGVDIPFSTLDAIGSKTGSVSLFPTFNIKNILGSAGMYFSKTAGQNGFGLFVDISNALQPIMFQDLNQSKTMSLSVNKSREFSAPTRLNYSSINPSSSAKSKIDDGLYSLHQKKAKLQLRK